MNARGHLTQASELHDRMFDLGSTLSRLRSVLRLARDMEFESLSNDEDALEDLCNAVCISVDMATTAKASCDEAEAQAGGLAQRMEGKPAPGDRIPAETLCEMFEALANRGNGRTPHQLSNLASVLGAYAEQDQALRPAFDTWMMWMFALGIKTAVDHSVKERMGQLRIYPTSAPGGIHTPIGANITGDQT